MLITPETRNQAVVSATPSVARDFLARNVGAPQGTYDAITPDISHHHHQLR